MKKITISNQSTQEKHYDSHAITPTNQPQEPNNLTKTINNMDTAFFALIAYVFGLIIGCVITHDDFTDRLIEAELAEYAVDSTTGDATFIIYAEQETK